MHFSWFRLDQREQKNFFWLLLIFFLYILPIILANAYFLDDLGRSIHGATAWEFDGRPVATLLIDLLNFKWNFLETVKVSSPIQDLAPYPLLIGIASLAYVIVLLSRRYLRTESLLILLGCQALCIMNPFMLENMTFHFDCVSMLLGLSLTFLCFALPDGLRPQTLFAWCFFLIFLVLCLYQSLIGAYLSLLALEILFGLYQQKPFRPLFHCCCVRVAGLLAAGLLYKCTIAAFLLQSHGAEHSKLLFPFTPQGWEQLRSHIHLFHGLLRSYTVSVPWIVSGIMIMIFLLFSWKWLRRYQGQGVKWYGGYILGVSIVLFASFLPMLLLDQPIVVARTLIFLAVIPFALGIMICAIAEQRAILSVTLIPLLMFGFYYVSAYGNVLSRQTAHDNMFAQQISYDINRLGLDMGPSKADQPSFELVVIGTAPDSRERMIASKKNPLMASIAQPHLREDWISVALIEHFSPYRFHPVAVSDEDRAFASSQEPQISNSVYRIYVRDYRIIVTFQ